MGPKYIMKARQVILVATGIKKAEAIKDTIEGKVSEQCPASVLQNHNNVVVYLDKDAAKHLKIK